MDQAEASGKTVEDALRKALAKLGATREQVELTVLDEGRRGVLFGRGGRDAVVRVEWAEGAKPPAREDREGERRARRGRRGRGNGQRSGDRERQARDTREPRSGRGRRGGGAGEFVETASPRLTEADFLARTPAASTEQEAELARREDREDQAPARARGRRGNGSDDAPRTPRRRREREREEAPVIEPNIDAEEVDFAATIVDDILRILDIDAEISLREPVTPGDGLGSSLAVIDIMGDDLGLIIGRRGETLLSLQYLVNLILSRRYPDRGGITIDAEHYRHRREEELMDRVMRMADRVRETGDPITLEPMSPAERRLVHLSLANDPDLLTESTGEGDNRKVVISLRE